MIFDINYNNGEHIICIANLNNIDLQECIYLKEEINCQKYNRKNMFEKDYEK